MSDEEDERFIIGRMRMNPVDDPKTPCMEILMDTASGMSKNELVLLKEVGKEDRSAYLDKSYGVYDMDREGALDQLNDLKDEVNDGISEELDEIMDKLIGENEKGDRHRT